MLNIYRHAFKISFSSGRMSVNLWLRFDLALRGCVAGNNLFSPSSFENIPPHHTHPYKHHQPYPEPGIIVHVPAQWRWLTWFARGAAQNLPQLDLAHFKKQEWGLENDNWLSIYSARLEEVLWQNDDFPAGPLGLTDLPLITTGAWQCLTRTTTLPHTARRSPLCHLECCCWWGGVGGEIFCFLSTPSYHSEWQLRPLCQLEHCAHN